MIMDDHGFVQSLVGPKDNWIVILGVPKRGVPGMRKKKNTVVYHHVSIVFPLSQMAILVYQLISDSLIHTHIYIYMWVVTPILSHTQNWLRLQSPKFDAFVFSHRFSFCWQFHLTPVLLVNSIEFPLSPFLLVWLVGGLEHEWIIFAIILGMSSSQHFRSPSFFRRVRSTTNQIWPMSALKVRGSQSLDA